MNISTDTSSSYLKLGDHQVNDRATYHLSTSPCPPGLSGIVVSKLHNTLSSSTSTCRPNLYNSPLRDIHYKKSNCGNLKSIPTMMKDYKVSPMIRFFYRISQCCPHK